MNASVRNAIRLACLFVLALFPLGMGSVNTSSALLSAQGTNPPPQDMPFTITGNIIDHSPGKITISGGQNMEFDVKYDAETEIQHQDGSPAKDSELKVGIDIQVKGFLTEAGDINAKKIIIETGAGGSKK